jgi:N-acetylneuraminic acid mutarotase
MKFTGKWETVTEYPFFTAEAQGGIVGHDLVVISGFRNVYATATAHVYALDLNNVDENSSEWRRMDDIPIAEGVTHAAYTIVGTKVYLCGG